MSHHHTHACRWCQGRVNISHALCSLQSSLPKNNEAGPHTWALGLNLAVLHSLSCGASRMWNAGYAREISLASALWNIKADSDSCPSHLAGSLDSLHTVLQLNLTSKLAASHSSGSDRKREGNKGRPESEPPHTWNSWSHSVAHSWEFPEWGAHFLTSEALKERREHVIFWWLELLL